MLSIATRRVFGYNDVEYVIPPKETDMSRKRTHHRSHKKRDRLLSIQDLYARGWTEALVWTLMPTPSCERIMNGGEHRFYWNTDYVELMEENPTFQKDLRRRREAEEKQRRLLSEALSDLPAEYRDYFPKARALYRHFYIHVGGTNTGKTHDAILDLQKAETGAYLAPLRLLALEVKEKFDDAGIPCSYRTGEERDIVPGAHFISETVEMLDMDTLYDVVVIDEAQMLSDEERGGAWTRAIVGAQAKILHICTAPEALGLVKKLIEYCDDTYEVIEHKRLCPLECVTAPFRIPEDIEPGDALIVFSRKSVMGLASYLGSVGVDAAVIYGALPYEARREQVKLFNTGVKKVVVATDAIGMGLNLPIRRIVFAESEKFDGHVRRPLRTGEIKQIAGRAGRYGIYDTGYVRVLSDGKDFEEKLAAEPATVHIAPVNFPESLIGRGVDTEKIISEWAARPLSESNELFQKADMTPVLRKLELLPRLHGGREYSEKDKYILSTMRFEDDNRDLLALWRRLCVDYSKGYFSGGDVPDKLIPPDAKNADLAELELQYKRLDLFHQFCERTDSTCNGTLYRAARLRVVNKINALLAESKDGWQKVCRECGRRLPWDYPFGVCDKCFHRTWRR